MKQIFEDTAIVGEIVAAFPQSSDFFKKHKIDFCCGGNRPLKDVIAERKLEKTYILNELNQLYLTYNRSEEETDWRTSSSADLIHHIVSEHHEYARSEVKQMKPYVNKVAIVHGDHHPHLKKVLELFNDLSAEITEHFEKEETTGFPAILDYENGKDKQSYYEELKVLVTELAEEHDQAGDILKQIREETNDYQLPEDACGTFRLVYSRLEMLEADMFQHIHLENNILFPRYMK